MSIQGLQQKGSGLFKLKTQQEAVYCAHCKRRFFPSQINQRFCSNLCARRQWDNEKRDKRMVDVKERYTNTCLECGKRFKSYNRNTRRCWRCRELYMGAGNRRSNKAPTPTQVYLLHKWKLEENWSVAMLANLLNMTETRVIEALATPLNETQQRLLNRYLTLQTDKEEDEQIQQEDGYWLGW